MTKPTKKQRVITMTVDEKINAVIGLFRYYALARPYTERGLHPFPHIIAALEKLQDTKVRK